MNYPAFAGAAVLIPLGIGIVWRSKRIGQDLRDRLGNAVENRQNREDDLPENDYIRNMDAVVAGLGFMGFMAGLGLVVLGFGAVNRL